MDRSMRFAAWTGLMAAALLTARLRRNCLVCSMARFPKPPPGSFAILVWMLPVAML